MRVDYAGTMLRQGFDTVRLHSPALAPGASVRRCKRAANTGGTPVRHLPRTAGAGDGKLSPTDWGKF